MEGCASVGDSITGRSWSTRQIHLLSLGCLAFITVVYSWPLLTNLTTSIPGRPEFADVTEYVWNAGWVRHALTTNDTLLNTDALFVPFGANLRLNTFGLLQGLLAFPFTGLLGVIGAYNLVLLATVFLNGAVAYALFFHQSRNGLAALIAAAWFMLSATILGQINAGRSALGGVWIVAGSLLVLISLLETPRLWKGVLLGLFLIAALLTDLQILLFTAFWLALYAAFAGYRHWRNSSLDVLRKAVLPLTVAGGIFIVPFLLIYFPAISGAAASGIPTPSLADIQVYAFQLRFYLNPALWPYSAGSYEVVLAVLAAVIIFRHRGPYRVWLAGALVLFVLALGPYLNTTKIPMPFYAFSYWSPLRQFRTPARLAIPAAIGLGMVATYVLTYLLPRLRSRVVLLLLVTLAIGGRLLMANAWTPLIVQTYPAYETYARIAAEPGDFALLEVPVGIRSGYERIGRGGEVVQYYQHIHGKRLVNGSMARLPAQLFDYYQQYPSLMFLSGEKPEMDDSRLDSDFADVLAWSKAGYVLVHRDLLDPGMIVPIEEFLSRQPMLEQLHIEDELVVYKVTE